MARASLAALCLWLGLAPAHAAEPVELELVLALDASSSVSAFEYRLQQQGIAAAFRDPSVHGAIRSLAPTGMVVAVVQWAGEGSPMVALDWTRLRGDTSARAFAERVETVPRARRGFTDIAGALRFSTRAIVANAFEGRRKVIDVSGDGTADGESPSAARDAAVAAGITVNGLVIHAHQYDLGELAALDLRLHYENEVTGGPGAFVEEARDFRDFAAAIRRKLLREISGAGFALRLPSE